MEEKEEIKTNGKSTETNNVVNEEPSTGLFENLKKLITDKNNKAKSFEQISRQYAEYTSAEPENTYQHRFSTFINLLFEGDIKLIEDFFDKEWKNLSSENKSNTIDQLLALTGDNRIVRQATIAHKIAASDSESASKIIFHFIDAGKEKSLESYFADLSKTKKTAIKNRFFPEKNGTWFNLKNSDSEVLSAIILFFSEMADEITGFGQGMTQGIALNFVKWVIRSIPQANLNEDLLVKIETRVNKIINRLTPTAQDDVKKLRNQLVEIPTKTVDDNETKADKSIESNEESNFSEQPKIDEIIIDTTLTQNDTVENKNEKDERNEEPSGNKSSVSPVVSEKTDNTVTKKFSDPVSGFISAEQLLKQKQENFDQLAIEIKVIKSLINERDSLKAKQKALQDQLDLANDAEETTKTKLQKLRTNFDALESAHKQSENDRLKTVDLNQDLKEENARLKQEVEQKTNSLESERSEYVQSSEQEVEHALKSFKGSLEGKLRKTFNNKRTTDNDPNSETLAEFLRGWFTEIEDELKKSDINP